MNDHLVDTWGHLRRIATAMRASLVEIPHTFVLRESVTPSLADALSDLIAQLDVVHNDYRYKFLWDLIQRRIGPYTGPTYDKQLNVARAVLAAYQKTEEKP